MAAPFQKVVCAFANARFLGCHRLHDAVTHLQCSVLARPTSVEVVRFSTSIESSLKEKDPLPLFLRRDVQKILKRITGLDINKLASAGPGPLSKPKYKLLTDEELRLSEKRTLRRLQKELQMPPYMNIREDTTESLSQDEELAGFDSAKYVFTDITFGISDRKRPVVIRDTDGTLRTATWEERDRMNHIYSPREGRLPVMPIMFQEEHFEDLLKKKKYVYILNRACVQFEPDAEDYIRVTHQVYQRVDDCRDYDTLRSTRHFGPMAFHFIWNKQIDFLLIDMLQRELVEDAGGLVSLYHQVHPDCPSAVHCREQPDQDSLDIVKAFCEMDARNKGPMELAIQATTASRAASQS